MRKERRTFDDTFKRNAVALLRGGRSIQSVADELQISKQLVSCWNHEQRDLENPEA